MDSQLMQGTLLQHESLARFTSWRVGGPARQIYIPSDISDLKAFLQQQPEQEPLLWLGLGSNTLVRDRGFPGTVIITQPGLHGIEDLGNGLLRAEAGVSCAHLARYSARLSLKNAEFLAGIPGTVGGALFMNAGCFGGETWSLVTRVETMDRQGNIHIRSAKEYQVAYRQVQSPVLNEWFVAGFFQLMLGDKQMALATIRDLLNRRAESQPTSDWSCGSVFRNPENDFAGRLIEASGLKGLSIGGACVSPKHANFIVNEGKASATDIEMLIHRVSDEVKRQLGVTLQTEVRIIGEE
jgi:UDP-N-acetylmuramate dehydrogenase